jgi:asparagine synthase (glutamine-hydrolysing)
LSIIDPKGGRQPLCNEDRRVWITYNGEIFNYKELRERLQAKGHRFSTQSDTEVIVHAYEEHGPGCLEHLHGQFAFAIWDGERLFCARDRIGIKPFHYAWDGVRFAFASEPRALLTLPDFKADPDLHGLRLFFRYRFIPAPFSAYRQIKKLRAGECLTLEREGPPRVRRYWDLAQLEVGRTTDLDQARERLHRCVVEAVRRQMVADVPVGAFLSGGVDSSTIVSLMSREVSAPVHTFTIGFPSPGNDERPFASEVAQRIRTQHADHLFDSGEAVTAIPDLLDHVDEPFGDASLLPTWALSNLASKTVKVALSGDGGDELFAGYGRTFRALQILAVPPILRPLWHLLRKVWPVTRDPSRWRYPNDAGVDRMYHHFLTRTSDGERGRLYGANLRDGEEPEEEDPVAEEFRRFRHFPPLARLLAVDLHTILAEYHLVKVDRASMRASLEVRVPFLDTDMIEFAFGLTPELCLYGDRSKGLLREAMREVVPPAILSRGKTGFGPPLKHWFSHELAGFAKERLSQSVAVRDGWLDPGTVSMLLKPRLSGKVKGSLIWRVLVFESWIRRLQEGWFRKPREASSLAARS